MEIKRWLLKNLLYNIFEDFFYFSRETLGFWNPCLVSENDGDNEFEHLHIFLSISSRLSRALYLAAVGKYFGLFYFDELQSF